MAAGARIRHHAVRHRGDGHAAHRKGPRRGRARSRRPHDGRRPRHGKARQRREVVHRQAAARAVRVDRGRPLATRRPDRAGRCDMPRAAKIVADPDHAPPNPMLGHVTSWCFSPNLDAWIALALVANGRARHGETLWAVSPLADARVRVKVGPPCFIDPEGESLVADNLTRSTPLPRASRRRHPQAWLSRSDVRRRVERPGRSGACAFADAARHFRHRAARAPNTTARHGALTALWLGPTSWLLVGSERVGARRFAARDALNGAAGALFDVTAQLRRVDRHGSRAASLLAKDCPLDFHPPAVPGEHCAQSVLGSPQRALLPPRPPDVHRDRRAELRARRLAGAVPIGGAIWLRRPASTLRTRPLPQD